MIGVPTGVDMDKYAIIEAAERQFAREVALGVIVERPVAGWRYLIPGMFIVDFLRRQAAVRQFTKVFMYPRMLALVAARAREAGATEREIADRVANDVRAWLQPRNLCTDRMLQALKGLVLLLAGHYINLSAAAGNAFAEMIANSYASRERFEDFIADLAAAETAVDVEIMERLTGHPKLIEKMKAEQNQIARRRRRLADKIY